MPGAGTIFSATIRTWNKIILICWKDLWRLARLGLLHLVREEATRHELPLYIVGGSVRDLVLGRRLNDFDLTVEGDAIALARALASKHGGGVTAHKKFGTAKWFLPENLKPSRITTRLT